MTVRKVRLFTLSESSARVAGGKVAFYEFQSLAKCVSYGRNNEFIVPSPETKFIDVDIVVKIENGVRQEEYIAIHPDLEEKLACVIDPKREDRLRRVTMAGLELTDQNIRLRERIEDFNKLPWYRRIFNKV